MVVFTDDSWPDGEERTYLAWDYIEVLVLYWTLRMEEGENTEFMEKDDQEIVHYVCYLENV